MMTRKRSTILAGVASPSYSWYQSMMGGYYGAGTGMMGASASYGSAGWMMSRAGYQWMTGAGSTSPGWMTGGLPAAMMGSTEMMGGSADPGQVMGRLFADAPGPRVSAAQGTALGGPSSPGPGPGQGMMPAAGCRAVAAAGSSRLTLLNQAGK